MNRLITTITTLIIIFPILWWIYVGLKYGFWAYFSIFSYLILMIIYVLGKLNFDRRSGDYFVLFFPFLPFAMLANFKDFSVYKHISSYKVDTAPYISSSKLTSEESKELYNS